MFRMFIRKQGKVKVFIRAWLSWYANLRGTIYVLPTVLSV